jgi:hypothetical protein
LTDRFSVPFTWLTDLFGLAVVAFDRLPANRSVLASIR